MQSKKTAAVHGTFTIEREMDFRVGGRERAKGQWTSGVVTDFQAHYLVAVGNKAGTRIKVTEQGVFLDGYDDAGSRERGTGSLLDALEKSLGEAR